METVENMPIDSGKSEIKTLSLIDHISLRLPEELLDAVRIQAKRVGIPYQRFMRLAIERAIETK